MTWKGPIGRVLEAMGKNPIETFVYGSIAAIVLGLSGQSCYQSVKESREIRAKFENAAAWREPTMLESPCNILYHVESHGWNPIDVTESLEKGMEALEDRLLFKPRTGRHEPLQDSVSPNGKWWASMCARGESGKEYLAKSLIRGRGPFGYEVDTWLLFGRENRKVYALSWEDEKIAGLPGKGFSVIPAMIPPAMLQVADNGACAYSIRCSCMPCGELGNAPSQARIIADISGRRKYAIPIKSIRTEFYPAVELSGDGSCARITESSYDKRFAELDIKKGTLAEKRK